MSSLSEVLASLTDEQRNGLSWGDRGGGRDWHAKWGDRSTIGSGGPYNTPEEAIRAVLGISNDRQFETAADTNGQEPRGTPMTARDAALNLMLYGKAEARFFTVPEWLAIDLLHTLPELEQVPDKETWTWTVRLS